MSGIPRQEGADGRGEVGAAQREGELRLEPADLVAALTDRARTLKTACYYPALAQNPTLHGRIVITLKITETGKVCSALVEKNEMATPAVADCSIEAYRNLSLPPPQGSSCILVSVPINFVPSPP
jgi:outer membrane biosynthesis protein TonB